jgi:ABC-type Mn2+/Zn2+ transport system ATPase subunit
MNEMVARMGEPAGGGARTDAIVMEGVSVVYEGERIPVVHEVDLRIPPGQFVTVLGPNGAGKTTLLEAINGMLPVTAGRVEVLGRDVATDGREVRKRTGYVIQNFSLDPLDPFLTRDVVMMARAGRIGALRFPERRDEEAVDKALAAVGMTEFAGRGVGKLSGGEFQKVLIARAMAQDPEVLLLDEPFANLDIDARKEAQDIVTGWRKDKDLTVVMVSHDIANVPLTCDRIVVIHRGRVIKDGTRDEVLASEDLGRMFGAWGGADG